MAHSLENAHWGDSVLNKPHEVPRVFIKKIPLISSGGA